MELITGHPWGENYSKKVDLVADARTSPDSPVKLTVSSNAPFTLLVDTGFARKEFAVENKQNQTFLIKR